MSVRFGTSTVSPKRPKLRLSSGVIVRLAGMGMTGAPPKSDTKSCRKARDAARAQAGSHGAAPGRPQETAGRQCRRGVFWPPGSVPGRSGHCRLRPVREPGSGHPWGSATVAGKEQDRLRTGQRGVGWAIRPAVAQGPSERLACGTLGSTVGKRVRARGPRPYQSIRGEASQPPPSGSHRLNSVPRVWSTRSASGEAATRGASGPHSALLDRYLGAALFELLLDRLGVLLGDVLLDRLGGALDQVLGLFQTEVGDLADHLDDIDLLGGVGESLKSDGELRLLLRLGGLRRGAASGRPGGHDDPARGGLDAVLLLEVVAQLDGLANLQVRNLVAEFHNLVGPAATVPFCHGCLSFL